MPSFLGHPRSVRIHVPAPVYATWNPAGTDGNITLSDGNLTAELTGAGGGGKACRTQYGRDLGRYYLEFVVRSVAGNPSGISVGLVDSDQIPNSELGNLQFGYAWRLDGYRESNGIANSYGSAAAMDDVIMMATRLYRQGNTDVADIYFGKGGIWFNGSNPVGDSSPAFFGVPAPIATDFLVAATFLTTGGRLTANFGASPFVFPVPVGYGAGWGENII